MRHDGLIADMLDASGALLAPPAIVPLFSKGDGVTITLMLARRGCAWRRRCWLRLRGVGALESRGAVRAEPAMRSNPNHLKLADWGHSARGPSSC